jgi:hypothetical protein
MATNDLSRPVAPSNDNDFTLTIPAALALYEAAGIPRNPRSIQRYCAKKILSSRRLDEGIDQTYLISRASVERHIRYIKEVTPPTSRDLPRLVATPVAPQDKDDTLRQETTTSDEPRQDPTPVAAQNKDDTPRQKETAPPDLSRQVATDFSIFEHPYVKRLEAEVEEFKGKYEKQIRRTEDVLEASNERLVAMAQSGQIANSETLAKYLLALKTLPPSPADHSDPRDADKV